MFRGLTFLGHSVGLVNLAAADGAACLCRCPLRPDICPPPGHPPPGYSYSMELRFWVTDRVIRVRTFGF